MSIGRQVHTLRRIALPCALGCSGCAGLVYQMVWFRMLGRAFGATAPAAATVLAVFMGGLGWGARAAGRLAHRMPPRRSLMTYAGLECAIAGLALLSSWLLAAIPSLYALLSSPATTLLVRNAVRLVISAGALLPPTFLMGATLPFMTQGLAPREGEASRGFGTLYMANNVGAVVGTLVSGFWLLRLWGETWTLRAAIGFSSCAALIAVWVARHVPTMEPGPRAEEHRGATLPWWLLLASAGAGLTVLGYEVIWSKTLVPLLGSTVYAYAAMLVAVLLGLSIGSASAARWGDKSATPQLTFAALSVLTALSALATYRWVPDLVVPTLYLLELSDSPAWRVFCVPLVVSAMLVLPATILSGAALPLGIRALAPRHGVATATGFMYAANTVGALAGSLGVGLVLIPMQGSRSAGGIIAVAGGLLCYCAALDPSIRARRVLLFLPVAVTVLIAVTQPPIDLVLFWGGIHMMSPSNRRLLVREGPETRLAGSKILYAAEGANTTVLVERRWGSRAFFVDGRPEATDTELDMRNQYLLAHVPALLHGNVKRSLVVGLGSGMTAGCLSLYGHVDVAELSSIVPGAARTFADLNHGVVGNPRVAITIEDGRAFLRTGAQRYDVITVDPIHPYVAGASTLYTRDYFAAVRARLNPGGIVSHWLPLYQLSQRDVRGVLRSFVSVFPDAIVYNSHNDAILVGNAGPDLPSAARFAKGFADPEIRADLGLVLIDTPEQLAALAAFRPAVLKQMVEGTPLITDDHTWIEYTAPFSFQRLPYDNLRELVARRELTGAESVPLRNARMAATAMLGEAAARDTAEARALLEIAERAEPSSRELALRKQARGF
ncbi:MAG: fused MFS/spermidine synthase [Polyangiales bacterium]